MYTFKLHDRNCIINQFKGVKKGQEDEDRLEEKQSEGRYSEVGGGQGQGNETREDGHEERKINRIWRIRGEKKQKHFEPSL